MNDWNEQRLHGSTAGGSHHGDSGAGGATVTIDPGGTGPTAAELRERYNLMRGSVPGPGVPGPGRGVSLGGLGGRIKFQPWLTLASGSGAGSPYEIIQPGSGWLRGEGASVYHMDVKVSFISGCTLYLETSTTPEGPWDSVSGITVQTDTRTVISSEGGSSKFTGLVRWRVSGDAPWQVCFQLQATPGAGMPKHVGVPTKV